MKKLMNILSMIAVSGLLLGACQREFIEATDQTGAMSKGEGIRLSAGSLPGAIAAYIQVNHPGTTIVKAEKKLNPDGSFRKYEIQLSNGVELHFNEAGELLRDDDPSSTGTDDSFDIPVSDLPQKIRDYTDSHYPGLSITRAKIRLNDDGSIRNYEVRLSNDRKLFFDADGNYTDSNN